MFEIYSTVTKKKKPKKLVSLFLVKLYSTFYWRLFVDRLESRVEQKKTEHYKPFFLKKKWYFLFCYMLHNNLSKQEQKKRQQSRRPYPLFLIFNYLFYFHF